MKLILFAMLFTITCAAKSAFGACIINVNSTPDVTKLIKKEGFTFKDFKTVCAKLNQANATMQIDAGGFVLDNKSIGVAVLTLRAKEAPIATNSFYSMRVVMNPYASQDKANELKMDAINGAAASWDGLDEALASLETERKKTAAYYRSQRN